MLEHIPIARRQFDMDPKCNICGRQRSIRVHDKCSKQRQREKAILETQLQESKQ